LTTATGAAATFFSSTTGALTTAKTSFFTSTGFTDSSFLIGAETGGVGAFATGVATIVGFSFFYSWAFGASIFFSTGTTAAAGTGFGTEIFSFGIFFCSALT